jgi:hypothetical protein
LLKLPNYLTFYLEYKDYFTFVDDDELNGPKPDMTFKTRKKMIHLFPKTFNKSELFPEINQLRSSESIGSSLSDSMDLGDTNSAVSL